MRKKDRDPMDWPKMPRNAREKYGAWYYVRNILAGIIGVGLVMIGIIAAVFYWVTFINILKGAF